MLLKYNWDPIKILNFLNNKHILKLSCISTTQALSFNYTAHKIEKKMKTYKLYGLNTFLVFIYHHINPNTISDM
jgi:hypothetical protein